MTHTQAVLISSLDLADPESGTDARRLIQQLLPEGSQVSFVPFARPDHDAYTAEAKAMLPLREVVGIHEDDEHLNHADAVFVGGGQTFRLLRALQQRHLLDAIRRRVLDDELVQVFGVCAAVRIADRSTHGVTDQREGRLDAELPGEGARVGGVLGVGVA